MTTIRPSKPREEPAPLSFELDDGEAAPAKSPSAPAPAFNPFADQKIELSPTVPTPAPVPAGTGRTVPPVVDSAPDEPMPSRDLWHCPHCGAGNQPKRTTCRSCGKDPRAPVVVPFYRQPVGIAIIALVIIAAVIGGVRATRTDKAFHAPVASQVDLAPRTWGLSDADQDLGDGRVFTSRGRISVCGRVVAAKSLPGYPWITTVVLALGDSATGDDFKTWTATITPDDIHTTTPKHVVLHCLFGADKPVIKPGVWLSVEGERGSVESRGGETAMGLIRFTQGDGHLTVKTTRAETSDG